MRQNLQFLLFAFGLFLILPISIWAQTDTLSIKETLGGDGYREGQYPGLGRAASEIFYSDKPVTFSGYAELANVFNGGQPRDLSSGDIELYFNQLYRFTPFLGVRINESIFLTADSA